MATINRPSFITSCCTLNPAMHVGQRDLFEAYVQWCIAAEQIQITKRAFYRRIRGTRGIGQSQRRIKGKAKKTFEGIGLKSANILVDAAAVLAELNIAEMVLTMQRDIEDLKAAISRLEIREEQVYERCTTDRC